MRRSWRTYSLVKEAIINVHIYDITIIHDGFGHVTNEKETLPFIETIDTV